MTTDKNVEGLKAGMERCGAANGESIFVARVKDVQALLATTAALEAERDAAEARAQAAEDKLAGCVEALTKIRDGDEPRRPVAVPWRKDGKPSKEDLCIHGNPMWEDCFGCVSDYTRAALARLENKEL